MKWSIIVLFVLCRTSLGFDVGDVVQVNLEPYRVICASNTATIKQVHRNGIDIYELTDLNCGGARIFAIDKHLTLYSALITENEE